MYLRRFEEGSQEGGQLLKPPPCISHDVMPLRLLPSRHFLFPPLLFSHVGHDVPVNIRRRDFHSRSHNEFVAGENWRCELRLWETRNVCHLDCISVRRAALEMMLFSPDSASIFPFFVSTFRLSNKNGPNNAFENVRLKWQRHVDINLKIASAFLTFRLKLSTGRSAAALCISVHVRNMHLSTGSIFIIRIWIHRAIKQT